MLRRKAKAESSDVQHLRVVFSCIRDIKGLAERKCFLAHLFLAKMEGRRGALDLSEEIELCGKLRNDIGKALKTDAHNAAQYGRHTVYAYLIRASQIYSSSALFRAQSECEESKALESLIETEALHLEENVATAETSFLHATASIEKIEVATAHLHETNSVLSQQLDRSLQLIDESTEGGSSRHHQLWMNEFEVFFYSFVFSFQRLRNCEGSTCRSAKYRKKLTRGCVFCSLCNQFTFSISRPRRTSVEALLRSIMNGEEQTRGLKAEMQTLKSTLEVLERTKEELIPVLESCEKAFGETHLLPFVYLFVFFSIAPP